MLPAHLLVVRPNICLLPTVLVGVYWCVLLLVCVDRWPYGRYVKTLPAQNGFLSRLYEQATQVILLEEVDWRLVTASLWPCRLGAIHFGNEYFSGASNLYIPNEQLVGNGASWPLRCHRLRIAMDIALLPKAHHAEGLPMRQLPLRGILGLGDLYWPVR